MVLNQIQDLLHDHDCVIIPDFGGLIAQYASAKIHPVKHTFTPPSKKIAFNEKLKHNDGLLISNLAQHLQIPNPEAQQMVAKFVGQLQTELNQNKRCELQGIGIFRYNAEHKLEFEYLGADNYLSHSFGLPELVARPVVPREAAALRAVRQKVAPKPVPAGKKGLAAFTKKYGTVAATVLTSGFTVAMVYYVSLNTEYHLSSLNPVALLDQNSENNPVVAEKTVGFPSGNVVEADQIEELPVTAEDASVKAVEEDYDHYYAANVPASAEAAAPIKPITSRAVTLAPQAETPDNDSQHAAKTSETKTEIKTITAKAGPKKEAKAETVAKPVEKVLVKAETKAISTTGTIKSASGRYYVISGGYATLANAERSKKQLADKGAANAEIILPTGMGKLHRVSVAEFETMELATAKLPELRKKYGNALWILNY